MVVVAEYFAMKNSIFKGLAGFLGGICLAAALGANAHAELISIGMQETGVNGGAITTEATGSGVTGFFGSYGSFSVNFESAADVSALGLPTLLSSNTLNIANAAPGTLEVWVTAQGLSLPGLVRQLESSFTVNGLVNASIVEKTYYSSSNALYGGTLLGTFSTSATPANSTSLGPVENLTGPFSVTEEYIITSQPNGSANLTATIAAVPEPSTWAMLLVGFAGVGFVACRKRSGARLRLA